MKYQFIEDNCPKGLKSKFCKLVGLSRASLYKNLSEKNTEKIKQDTYLKHQILSIHEDSKETYGSPRVYKSLNKQGIKCGENKVAKIMNSLGINANLKKKFKVKTTDSNHQEPIAARVFKVENEDSDNLKNVWAGDITYLPFNGNFLYLSVVMNLENREILGWNIRDSLNATGVIDALKMAIGRKKKFPGVVFHSDRGVQYASLEFRKLIKDNDFIPSMSRKGNCYDNSFVESFFRTLKTELIYRKDFINEQHLRNEVFEFIEVWYNRKRSHSSLDYMSPVEYGLFNKTA